MRATHIEWIDAYPNYSRPFHLEMPLVTDNLSDLMAYSYHHEMALTIPLALPQNCPLMRFEGLCKGALFLARQMLTLWDLREASVPIFIGVSENALPIFRQYAAHCNFPDAHIVRLPSYAQCCRGYQCALDTWDALGVTFKRLVHFDASLWVHYEGMSPCQSLLAKWHTPDSQFMAILPMHLYTRPQQDFTVDMALSCFGTPDMFYEALGRIMGTTAEAERNYWTSDAAVFVPGCVYGVSTQFWQRPEVVSLVKALREITTGDEPPIWMLAREFVTADSVVPDLWGITGIEYTSDFTHETCAVWQEQFMTRWRETLGYSISELGF